MPKPTYGASEHYTGEAGEHYFAKQSRTVASEFNLQFFQPHIQPTASILDFGCGAGDLLELINADTKVGIEINPAAQEYARSRGLEVHAEIDDVAGRQFDHIITSHALEHVPSPYHALLELRTVLKPDGTLIWLSPLDDWRSRTNRRWIEKSHDMHLYAWTPQTIGNLLTTAGYQPQQVRILTHAVPPKIGKRLWKLNHSLFELAAYLSAVLLRRRQILVVARPKP